MFIQFPFSFIILVPGGGIFSVGIESIIFTLSNPLKGSPSEVVADAVSYCLPRMLLIIIIYILLCIIDNYLSKKPPIFRSINYQQKRSISTQTFRQFISLYSAVVFMLSIVYADLHFHIFDYLLVSNQTTTIYEDYYVNPETSNIRYLTPTNLNESGSTKKNLIHIYLESMETVNASLDCGGVQNVNYIPKLTALAQTNTSFSNTTKLGGFFNTSNTCWTFASLLAQTSGVPFSFSVGRNQMSNYQSVAKNLTTMGDILSEFGYNQTFLCGSDGDFAGRKTYFVQHGNYNVLDYYSAIEKNYISPDYKVFWGYEDCILFDIAKQELTSIAQNSEPFNFTMLTVDTHFPNGYMCSKCDNEYESQIANAYACSDRQVFEFIEWCKTQDFYENTVIVITGAHPLMNTSMIENINGYENIQRTIYNCFINCSVPDNAKTTNRIFTPMDIFPTTLSAMGFIWDGDRLGLGTNLFSETKTLAEEIGFNNLDRELKKHSSYYLKNFC